MFTTDVHGPVPQQFPRGLTTARLQKCRPLHLFYIGPRLAAAGVNETNKYLQDWQLSPIKAPSLKSLPPALIVTAEFDILRVEGDAYAGRLRSEGVEATCVRVKGVPHPFPLFDAVLDAGKKYNIIAVEALRRGIPIISGLIQSFT